MPRIACRRNERRAGVSAAKAFGLPFSGGHPPDSDEPFDLVEEGCSLTRPEWRELRVGFADSAFDVLEQRQELKARAAEAGFDDVQEFLDFLEQESTSPDRTACKYAWLLALHEARLTE